MNPAVDIQKNCKTDTCESACEYWLYCNETNNKLFFRLIFFIISFVVIDTFIQYLFGSDIFGNEFSTSHGKRLSGPFGDEYVVGAYLSKLIFVGIIYLIQIKKNEYFN